MGARGEQPVAREGASVSPERAPQSRRGPGCAATVGESVGCVVQGPAHASQGAHRRTATASKLAVGASDRPVGMQSEREQAAGAASRDGRPRARGTARWQLQTHGLGKEDKEGLRARARASVGVGAAPPELSTTSGCN